MAGAGVFVKDLMKRYKDKIVDDSIVRDTEVDLYKRDQNQKKITFKVKKAAIIGNIHGIAKTKVG